MNNIALLFIVSNIKNLLNGLPEKMEYLFNRHCENRLNQFNTTLYYI